MAEFVFLVLLLGAAFVLAMKRAPLWAYAAAARCRDRRLVDRARAWRLRIGRTLGLLMLLGWLPAVCHGRARRCHPSAAP